MMRREIRHGVCGRYAIDDEFPGSEHSQGIIPWLPLEAMDFRDKETEGLSPRDPAKPALADTDALPFVREA